MTFSKHHDIQTSKILLPWYKIVQKRFRDRDVFQWIRRNLNNDIVITIDNYKPIDSWTIQINYFGLVTVLHEKIIKKSIETVKKESDERLKKSDFKLIDNEKLMIMKN